VHVYDVIFSYISNQGGCAMPHANCCWCPRVAVYIAGLSFLVCGVVYDRDFVAVSKTVVS
jgi:hypothetical protein